MIILEIRLGANCKNDQLVNDKKALSMLKFLVQTKNLQYKESDMELEIIAIYCWCDLILKHLTIKEDIRSAISNAEVITTAIVAVRLFSGNFESARRFLGEHGYIPNMLSKSRLNRL